MTNCEQIWDDLKAYSDGELPVMARLRVRRHVSQCAACREEIEAMELIRRRLRQNDASAFTPELKDKILAGIPDGMPPTDETLPVRNKKKPLLIFGATAAAAMCWFLFYPMTQGKMSADSAANKEVATGATASMPQKMGAKKAAIAKSETENAPTASNSVGSAMQMYAQDYDEQFKDSGRAASAGAGEAVDHAKYGTAVSAPEEFPKVARDEAPTRKVPAASEPLPFVTNRTRANKPNGALPYVNGASVDTERQVHRDASLTVQVDSAEAKSEKVETLLKAEGGYVADSNLNTLDDGTKSSTMTLKVPVDKFESFMATLSKLGEVKAKSVSGEDLTERISDEKQGKRVLGEEIADTQARLNQRRQTKAQERQDREDLRELKTRIAVKQARLDLYKKMATLSNISLTLSEKPKNPPPTPAPLQSGFMHDLRDTASDAGQAFLQAAKLPFVLLIWIAVYSPVWLILLAGYRYFVVRG